MKALLDEGVPRRLAVLLRAKGSDVSGFPNAWKGLQNGELLRRMQSESVGCLITCDKNLVFQQNFISAGISSLVLPTQDIAALTTISDLIAAALRQVQPGVAVLIGHDGSFETIKSPLKK
ncbi:hypothetical protein [Aurantimonas sp. VKM B-3413]|uniref:hypothetical protein n=1 Tax=Aurantimonas sp. VKM B-3413 TaxID=2779401 RepID=UPI001E511732|nr:hypothetical protein [Aurantimonas sp. VKM B-3413]MCB8838440.1 hypothetical protein [Aurantimonas sp. VKM B-3413]